MHADVAQLPSEDLPSGVKNKTLPTEGCVEN